MSGPGGKRVRFTLNDLLAGLSPQLLQALLDDVKWRDGGCKVVQYGIKLSGAVINDYGLVDPTRTKEIVSVTNHASTLISTARRCFRFVRWLPSLFEAPSAIADKNAALSAVKIVALLGNVTSSVAEDITTLGRLNLIDSNFANQFTWIGNFGWFTESAACLILHFLSLNKAIKHYKDAKLAYKNAVNEKPSNPAATRAAAVTLFKAYTVLHFSRITFAKFVCEVVASTHDLGYHSYTKIALASSLLSAVSSTYSNTSKHWPSQ